MIIYLTLDTTPFSGGGQVILNELTKYEKNGDVLFCPAGLLANEARRTSNATIITFNNNDSTLQKIVFIKKQIKKYNKKGNILSIHGISALALGVVATAGTSITKCYTEHLLTKEYKLENKFNYSGQLLAYRLLLTRINHITAVSNAVKEFLVNNLRIPEKKVTVTYNPVPTSQKHVEYRYKRTTGLVTIGSLIYIKNYSQLLTIFAEALKKSDLTLTIIGDGDQRDDLMQQASSLGILNKVTFTGNIPHDKIEDYLEQADIYVQTSFSESFGFAITEALAIGLPVVAFDVGGIGEVVEHNKSGLLVLPYDTPTFVDSIVALADDVELRRRFGNYGREAIRKIKP